MKLRRGIVKGFNTTTYRATVQLAGSLGVWLDDIPVARNIAGAEMVSGRSCALVFFDPANPIDAVVVAVYAP